MTVTYPLSIQNLSEETYCVMSKGHHDPDKFMAEVKKQGYTFPLGHPAHVWIKTNPCKDGERHCHYTLVTEGTRGAWPATYAWEAYGAEEYRRPEAELKEESAS